MGLSRRAYASLGGVHESAVRKAIATGRITTEADGTIDAAKADALWHPSTNPAKQRGADARDLGRGTASATRAVACTNAVPLQAFAAVVETLTEDGADAGDGGEVSFVTARMANEVLNAQTARVRLQKMKVEVVDRARATAMVFDLARRERDAWLNWPPRVAADIATELGAEPHAVEQVLMRYLRRHLAEMSDVKVELRLLRSGRGYRRRLRARSGARSGADRGRMGRSAPHPVVAGGVLGRAVPDASDALSESHSGGPVAEQPGTTARVYEIRSSGATKAGNNWIGFCIHRAPGPILAVQPTTDLAKRLSQQRIEPLIEESPDLRALVLHARSRDVGNTVLAKRFPGGQLVLMGTKSVLRL